MDRRQPHQHSSFATKLPRALIAAALAFSAGSAAAGLIEPTLQIRRVSADAGAEGDFESDSTSAVDLEPFNTAASAQATGQESSAWASADQLSQIGADSVTGQGTVDASAFGPDAHSFADSDCEFRFTIGGTAEYDFSASVAPDDFGTGVADVWFEDLTRDETIAAIRSTGQSHVSATGLLEPGEYRIVGIATADGMGIVGSEGITAFSFSLSVVPEPSTALLQLSAIACLAALVNPSGRRGVIWCFTTRDRRRIAGLTSV